MIPLIDFVARRWWLLLLRGMVALVFGAMALAWPGPTAAALVLLLGAYLLVDGIVGIVDARAIGASCRIAGCGCWRACSAWLPVRRPCSCPA